jgi:putative ABC transport system permease protein
MSWFERIRNVFRDNRLEREIDREVSFHIAERADELQNEGMSEEDALTMARRQFGNITGLKERTRGMDISEWMETIVRNFRYAGRALMKSPGFTVTVVLTLALGIGANSAVFSAIHAVLLRPMPFPEGDQLMVLRQLTPKNGAQNVAPLRLKEWERMNSTFQMLTGYYAEDNSE